MKKYLEEYIRETDKKINENKITKKDIEDHLIKINFFQHERLIHLLVTLSYAVYLFLSIIIFTKIWQFVVIVYIILIILLFYVKYYFFLETRVQYLYKEYDNMEKIITKKN